MPWRPSRSATARARSSVALGRAVAAFGGQQRVHARRGAVDVLGERAGVVAGDRRDDVARAVGGQLGAERDDAAREVAAEPGGAAHDVARARGRRASAAPRGTSRAGCPRPPRGPRRRATSVRQATAARCRYSAASSAGGAVAAEQQHGADELVAAADRRLGGDPVGHAGGPVADAVGDVAAQRRRAGRPRPAGERGRAEARHDDRHGRAGRSRGEQRHALEAVAVQHGVDHLQVHLPQPRDDAPSRRIAGRRVLCCEPAALLTEAPR